MPAIVPMRPVIDAKISMFHAPRMVMCAISRMVSAIMATIENIVVRTRSSLGGVSLTLTFLAFAPLMRTCLVRVLRIKHIGLYSEGSQF
ncbi:MAG: hypothetical protein OEY31_00855 [Candidatus Bathyarchaeota archaeon]|nr:hypothetical protein [Candidatus Bathyarchaeota archaeon]